MAKTKRSSSGFGGGGGGGGTSIGRVTGPSTIGGGSIGTGTGGTPSTTDPYSDPPPPPTQKPNGNLGGLSIPTGGVGGLPTIDLGGGLGARPGLGADYTGDLSQFGVLPQNKTVAVAGDGNGGPRVIYRDRFIQGAPGTVTQNVLQGQSEADRMKSLAGANSEYARNQLLNKMATNSATTATFDPRAPQTGGLFSIKFRKAGDSASPF